MTNTELGQSIRNGDESAFTLFFNRNYGWVYRRAFRCLKSREDAEDTASKVFVKAWQHREKYNAEKGTFMAWFSVLCQRAIIDARRIQARDYKVCRYGDLDTSEDNSIFERIADTCQSALDGLIAEEQQIRIEDALCKIKRPEHRLVWILHHFEGYSYPEIAKIIKRAEGTCKIWVRRCNQLLQRILTDG